MSDTERPVGNLRTSTPGAVAEKAARTILTFTPGSLRAVTVDPRGRVHVEPVCAGSEPDRVGVYVAKGPAAALAAAIEQDLKVAARALRKAAA